MPDLDHADLRIDPEIARDPDRLAGGEVDDRMEQRVR
jgi:hypothetical protein